MKTISLTTRKRLEMQGFLNMNDADLAEIRPWLRLSPILTILWMGIGLFAGSAKVIWAIIPFLIFGGFLPRHPFDVVYNYGIRFLIGARALPKYHLARRVCCIVASVWASLVGWALYSGAIILAYVLGSLFISAALIPIMTDFCVPSYLYGLVFGKPLVCQNIESVERSRPHID
jgi:hypothetical protein